MKSFISFFRKHLLVPILVSLFSLTAGYLFQQLALTKAKPILRKEVVRFDLSGLPDDLKRQITLVPINYSLHNNSRSPAQNVSIFIKSDSILQINDLKFSQDSEDHQYGIPDPHEFRVNVPTIRPGGFVSFQIITSAANKITFSERSDNALFATQTGKGVDEEKQKATLVELAIGAAILFVWLPVLSILIYVFWKTGKSWQRMEASTEHPNFRNRLIILIIALYIYDDLFLGSLGPIGLWMPLPRISFGEMTAAFVFYLFVTRYKLLENLIVSWTEKMKRDTQGLLNGKERMEAAPLVNPLAKAGQESVFVEHTSGKQTDLV